VIGAQRVDFIAVPRFRSGPCGRVLRQTLGLGRNPNNSGERWVEYETGNLTIALSQYGGGIGIRVEDVDEARRAAEAEGLEFSLDTFDSGVCHGAPFPGSRRQPAAVPPPVRAARVVDTERRRGAADGLHRRQRPRPGALGGLLPRRGRPAAEPALARRVAEFDTSNVGLLLSTPEQKGETELQPEVLDRAPRPGRGHVDGAAAGEGGRVRVPGVFDSDVCHMAFSPTPTATG
jgi:hypothetical protein